jgi:hypothetical protein
MNSFFFSWDPADSWELLANFLPPILSVETAAIDWLTPDLI